MKFTNVLVALKEGVDHTKLLVSARTAAEPPARIHLVTLVRVGTHENEVERLSTVKKELRQTASALEGDGYEASIEARLLAVNAATDLIDIAKHQGTDLIVIGLAKRSRVGKALLGSDAQRILLSATCPVLSTHPSNPGSTVER